MLEKGRVGKVYNIGSNASWKIVRLILKDFGKPESLSLMCKIGRGTIGDMPSTTQSRRLLG